MAVSHHAHDGSVRWCNCSNTGVCYCSVHLHYFLKNMTAILGISAFYHDSAAALIVDGEIVAAAQEERFSRIKHDSTYPTQAVDCVLELGGLTLAEVDYVAFYDKPFLKFERLLETYVAFAPKGFKSFRMSVPVWLREKLFLKDKLLKDLRKLDKNFKEENLLFGEHHMSHAASAFYPSPFDEALVLVMDGVGEWATTSVAIGKGSNLEIVKEIHFPHSLGLLYSAFTYYTGFKVNSGEYKLMGLAPYGEPKYASLILEHLIDLKDDGSFHLEQKYFDYATGLTMTNDKFANIFGHPARTPEVEPITQFHMDVAASIQAVTEEVILRLTRALSKEYKVDNLCLAGGVALNCVANGKLLKDGFFKNIWVQPAAGDAGGALGVALSVWYQELNNTRDMLGVDSMKGAYLGPKYEQSNIEQELNKTGAIFETLEQKALIDATADAIASGLSVGWFQGRMEFGPRALGARSILADPRSEATQKALNLKIKYRESFRPFAPSVLRSDVKQWFDLDSDSPYMLMVAPVAEDRLKSLTEQDLEVKGLDKVNVARSEIPAVTHVDNTARIQTVDEVTNPTYHALLSRFKEITGCPVLVNTSFNVRGEPIVCTPRDAFRCFMGTELDVLVCGNSIMWKDKQEDHSKEGYYFEYDLD